MLLKSDLGGWPLNQPEAGLEVACLPDWAHPCHIGNAKPEIPRSRQLARMLFHLSSMAESGTEELG